MVTHPKISVLIPVYNVEKYVKRCIDSVLSQTMQDGVEVIIVNDCTPDRSMEIIFEALRAYNMKTDEKKMTVRVVNHDTNRGLAAVRNTAMSYATGDYTIHVDSDDWVEPDMLEKMYAKAIEEDADIVIADFYFAYEHKEVYSSQECTDIQLYFGEIINGMHVILWNKLIKKSLYTDNDIHWFEGIDRGEDSIAMVQLFHHAKKVASVSHAFYHYVQYNPNSITYVMSEKSKRNCIQKIEFIRQYLKEHSIIGYEKHWAFNALQTRFTLLVTSSGKEREDYFYIFPEANAYLGAFIKQASLQQHLILCHHFHLYDMLRAIKRSLKRMFPTEKIIR